jgi:hypothetical protein
MAQETEKGRPVTAHPSRMRSSGPRTVHQLTEAKPISAKLK